VFVYKGPKDMVVTKQDSAPMTAPGNALDALERMVYESREKLGTRNSSERRIPKRSFMS